MRPVFPLVILTAAGVWAQAPGTKPVDPAAAAAAGAKAALQGQTSPATAGAPATPAPASLMSLNPSLVVATVDGKQVTAGDLQVILRTIPPQVQQQALSNRRMLLEQYGVARRLAAEAEKAKLEQLTPWKETIENLRMQVLANAYLNQKLGEIRIPDDVQKKEYESNKANYVQVKVKAIYIPFVTAPAANPDPKGKKQLTEAEAKAKADDLVKQIRAGADFVKLVKEHSGDPTSSAKDGDFGTIHKGDRVPEDVKAAVFSLKPGEVTEPLRQASGFYIFRAEETGTQPFEQVQSAITNQLREAQFQQWIQSVQKSVDIKMMEPEASSSPAAPVAPPAK